MQQIAEPVSTLFLRAARSGSKAAAGLALGALFAGAAAARGAVTLPLQGEAPETGSGSEGADAAAVETRHEVVVGGSPLRYTAEAGTLPIRSDTGETEGEIFYIAYTAEEDSAPADRPLTFSFNGGPGSSSVWLHLGALGPRRVKMLEDGGLPAPPYSLVDNESSWLDLTDLVFIDPVGTGYSRPETEADGEKFWGLEQDIRSVGEFIRLYLTRNERWASPLYLVGESYGTTRAAGLSGYLVNRSGIAFNGVLLVSTVLDFGEIRFREGNDLPYLTFFPTYAATAWYHGALREEWPSLDDLLTEARRFAYEDYWPALARGAELAPAERSRIAAEAARLTGLDPGWVEDADLRIEAGRFRKELLRDRGRTVGRLDSRFLGRDRDDAGETFEFDPSMAAIRAPYTAAFNDYVRRELGYEDEKHYWILGGGIGRWDFGGGNGYAETRSSLRDAMLRNPYMRVFVASGYYDMATPFFGAEYTMNHLGIPAELRENITIAEYEAGHMMYIDEPSLVKFKVDVAAFYAGSSDNPAGLVVPAPKPGGNE